MIELILFNKVYNIQQVDNNNTLSPSERADREKGLQHMAVASLVLYLTIFVWSIYRAMACSQPNPDSRCAHFLFATISPVMYIAFSYLIPNFCNDMSK